MIGCSKDQIVEHYKGKQCMEHGSIRRQTPLRATATLYVLLISYLHYFECLDMSVIGNILRRETRQLVPKVCKAPPVPHFLWPRNPGRPAGTHAEALFFPNNFTIVDYPQFLVALFALFSD